MARSEWRTSPDISRLLREARNLIRDCNMPGRKAGAHLKRELIRNEVTAEPSTPPGRQQARKGEA